MKTLKLESRVVERRTVGGGSRHALEPSNISTIKSGEGAGGGGGGGGAGCAGWTEGAVGVGGNENAEMAFTYGQHDGSSLTPPPL